MRVHRARLQSDHFDFDFGIDHQRRLHAGARRQCFMKVAGVDAVESLEIARVVEPDIRLDDVFQRAARLFQNGDDALDAVVGLRDDAAGDDFAVIAQRDLAGHEHETVGDRRLAEGQMLPARTGSRTANTLDRHRILPPCASVRTSNVVAMIYQKCSVVKQKCSENDMAQVLTQFAGVLEVTFSVI